MIRRRKGKKRMRRKKEKEKRERKENGGKMLVIYWTIYAPSGDNGDKFRMSMFALESVPVNVCA